MVKAPWWRPDQFGPRLPVLKMRAAIASKLRAYFAGLGFAEVDTPALQRSPGVETHLQVFATDLKGPHPDDHSRAYLHTSPEYAMKKLLVAGMPRIFQLAHVFRNKERSSTHHPEFTMLEWYRAGAGYLDLVDDIHGLLMATASAMHQGPMMRSGDITCDATAIPDVITVADAFGRFADIDLLEAMDDALAPDPRPLIDRSEAIGLPCAQDDTWEDVFFRIFLDRIEPHLGAGRPTVLTDYPASMAALARIKRDEPRLCERFELYICGVELANAFGELTDPVEQRRRFEADLAAREARYGDRLPIDEDFLAALEQGMPEAAGIALGFDRLVMLAAGADQIEDVLWAPVF